MSQVKLVLEDGTELEGRLLGTRQRPGTVEYVISVEVAEDNKRKPSEED